MSRWQALEEHTEEGGDGDLILKRNGAYGLIMYCMIGHGIEQSLQRVLWIIIGP